MTVSRFARLAALCAALLGLLALGGCAKSVVYTNSDGRSTDKPLAEVLRWQWTRDTSAADRPVALPVRLEPRGTAPARPGELSATWVGHATVLLRIGGLTVLTDPMFSRRASPVGWAGPERRTPLPFELAALPHIDLVLISHNHYDHLDEASVLGLQRQAGGAPLFIVPQGLDVWFRDRGITTVRSLGWWETLETLEMRPVGDAAPAVQVTGVPAVHWSSRSPFDRNDSHWGGWVLRFGSHSVYFAGDTGYGDGRDFRQIGQRFPALDLALIPVGAYEPRWFMREQHVDPAEAMQIFRDLGARRALGIHWGTFALTDEALDAPIAALDAARRSQGVAEA
ncbi:MAG TPA: MBL fold metallo-hydrolase, partial [Burkholderiaceae bacterium]|nr:MBL fold metallo-hydrolase [Burkholderiaceae bacterium]